MLDLLQQPEQKLIIGKNVAERQRLSSMMVASIGLTALKNSQLRAQRDWASLFYEVRLEGTC